jgi:squalene cyclase
VRVPDELAWLFWEVDPSELEVFEHRTFIIPRVLEKGRFTDVKWVLSTYGEAEVHAFLRDVGHPELSRRTLAFWRAYFEADGEVWRTFPSRTTSGAPWIA